MHVEPVDLFGRRARDFVIYGEDGLEQFAARLWDDESILYVMWTDNLPRTAIRLRQVQHLDGRIQAFDTIQGQASDTFREEIMGGTFDTVRAERLLSRALGGVWQLTSAPRPGSIPPTFDITCTRIEG